MAACLRDPWTARACGSHPRPASVADSALPSLQPPVANSCEAPQNTPPLLGPPTVPDSRAVLACTPLRFTPRRIKSMRRSIPPPCVPAPGPPGDWREPLACKHAITLAAAFDGALSPLTDKLLAALRVPTDLAPPPKSVCPMRKTRPRHSLPPHEPVPGIAHKAEGATPRTRSTLDFSPPAQHRSLLRKRSQVRWPTLRRGHAPAPNVSLPFAQNPALAFPVTPLSLCWVLRARQRARPPRGLSDEIG